MVGRPKDAEVGRQRGSEMRLITYRDVGEARMNLEIEIDAHPKDMNP